METNYTVDYFIDIFENLKDGDVGRFMLSNKCAYHHCGDGINYEGVKQNKFTELFKKNLKPSEYKKDPIWLAIEINDGGDKRYNQSCPRQRIIAALYDIKAKENPQPTYNDITSELAVLPIQETSDVIATKETILS